jgi:Domain of unknown function (DUF929)
VGRETNRQRRDKQASTAREKAAAARATQARIDQRRRARTILFSVVAAAVAIAVVAVLAINSGGGSSSTASGRTVASPAIVNAVTGVPATMLDQIGQGSAQLIDKPISDQPISASGKPELLFVGAEFCPFCAAERWSLVQALSRFGTFSNLKQVHSGSDDGDLATFSFYKSSYTSKYLSFVPVENEDRNRNPLESVTSAQKALWNKYTQESFPFLDFNGMYYQDTSGYNPDDLSGLTWTQISNDLKDPSSTIAKDILGESNVLTAMICKMTNGQPASVCQSTGVSTITPKLAT